MTYLSITSFYVTIIVVIKVYIYKPVYQTFVYVREKYLKQAKREGTKIEITCPDHKCIVSPDVWMKEGKRLEKVFKDPDHPMVLWGNLVEKYESL
jgi:hypothetical protein